MSVFDSLLDVPLDEYADDDGDDSAIPERGTHSAPLSLGAPFALADYSLAVPFIPSKRGDKGKHVKALNRALSRAGFRQWQVFSATYTIWVETAVMRFQKAHGLTVNGIYNKATHAKLASHYDAYSIKYLLVAPVPEPTKDELERADFISELMYLYNRRYTIPYSQTRPGSCGAPPHYLDCSFSGEWAGAHSPIGSLSGFSGCGYGNTGSQLERFRRLGRVRSNILGAKPGDPRYYGTSIYHTTHVAYFLGRKDGVARVWSFGSFPIKVLDANYRHDAVADCNLTGRT